MTLSKSQNQTQNQAFQSALESYQSHQLRWLCDPKFFEGIDWQQVPPKNIGQPRAEKAIEVGVKMEAPGHHVFVCGPGNIGKMSAVKSILQKLNRPKRERFDYLYIHHFQDRDRPLLVTVSPGQGKLLKRQMERFVERLPEVVKTSIKSSSLDRKRKAFLNEIKKAEEASMNKFKEEVKTAGFLLHQIEGEDGTISLEIQVLHRKKAIALEDLIESVQAGRLKGVDVAELQAKHDDLEEKYQKIMDKLFDLERKGRRKIYDQEAKTVGRALQRSCQSFLGEFLELPPLQKWVDGLKDWVEDHLEAFLQKPEGASDSEEDQDEDLPMKNIRLLKVNLIMEAPTEPPVIFEDNPSFSNLLGTIEKSGDDTHTHLDFNDIRTGSLLKANGGILVINADEASIEGGVAMWRALLRSLKSRSLEIQATDQLLSSSSPLKPEPIPLDVKVIAIGDEDLYRILFTQIEDFGRVFKIKAEFDDSFQNNEHSLEIYKNHAIRVVNEEKLPTFSPSALALWAEYGTRLSGRRDRLSSSLGELTDLLREATYYAQVESLEQVDKKHIQQALQARVERHQLIEDQLFMMIEHQHLELNPNGSEIGAVHGLTVLDFGDHSFGQPCRITATTTPGMNGVISIEKEVKLSGKIHDKAAMMISAYLRSYYMPNQIVALNATLAFEQLHDEVEGDSASIAEAIALISNLSQRPVDQGIAITGAIDQRGRVQAVGGTNEKIEGFFRLCQLKGLNGKQGVIMPASNVDDLALSRRVLEAIDQKQFMIWGVKHINEVIELSFHQSAGTLQENGTFPKNSINELVRKRLEELSKINAEYFKKS